MKMKSLLLTIAATLGMSVLTMAQWTQLGSDIIGQIQNEASGFVTDLDSAGNRLAVGAPGSSINGVRSGKVQVYQFDGTDWMPLGVALLGDNENDEFGSAVKLSADGNTLAVGAPMFWTAETPPGYVRVFNWNGTEWLQRGNDLSGGVNGDGFGAAIDLNSSGDILAIGAPYTGSPVWNAGAAFVYQWTGLEWMPMGSSFAGTELATGIGGALQLNDAGTILALGQKGPKRVVVFDWSGSDWISKDTIQGDTFVFGNSISMDASGNTIAVGGEPLSVSNGRVRVFQFNGTQYQQKGSHIDGQGDDLFLGGSQYALALRGDGNVLVAGSQGNIVNGQVVGRARVLQFDGQDWIQTDEIPGSDNDVQMGRSVCLNAGGSILALGTPFSPGGIVRVYTSSMPTGLYENHPTGIDLHIYPNPATDNVYIRSSSEILYFEILSPAGQIITRHEVAAERETKMDISFLSPGTYILKVNTRLSSATIKLIRRGN